MWLYSRIPLPSSSLFVASIRFPQLLSPLFVAVASEPIALISFICGVQSNCIAIIFICDIHPISSLICDIQSDSIALILYLHSFTYGIYVESHRCAAICRLWNFAVTLNAPIATKASAFLVC